MRKSILAITLLVVVASLLRPGYTAAATTAEESGINIIDNSLVADTQGVRSNLEFKSTAGSRTAKKSDLKCETVVEDDKNPETQVNQVKHAGQAPGDETILQIDRVDVTKIALVSSTIEAIESRDISKLSLGTDTKLERQFSDTGRWIRCEGIDGLIPINDTSDAAIAQAIIYQIVTEVSPGEPEVSTTPVKFETLAQAPTIFNINQEYWQPYTDTLTVSGVTVNLTLTPYRSVWSPGDGNSPLICEGPGKPYTGPANIPLEELNKTYQQDYPCSHKYTKANPRNETYTLATTVRFKVDITTSPANLVGPQPDWITTTYNPIKVTELQALTINEGSPYWNFKK